MFQVYGFYAESLRKYGSATVWTLFTDLFDFLPIAALVDGHYLCVHGGLSPSAHYLDQIRVAFRFKEVPHEGLIADLLWSDPSADKNGFSMSTRGAGYVFGGDVVAHFLWLNNLDAVIRGHQLCMEGYQALFDKQLVTVWSAPNYCYRCGNVAAILEFDSNLERCFKIFREVPESEYKAKRQQQLGGGGAYFM